MRMKKLLVIIILLGLVVPSVKATGQSGDIIRLEGEEWVLMAKPLGYDSLLCRRMDEFLPENVSRSTDNYSGYTAFGRCVTVAFACNGEKQVFTRDQQKESTQGV